MPTDPNEIQLNDEQRAILAAQAERTGRPWDELLGEFFDQLSAGPGRKPRAGRSFLDAMQERGLVGAMQGPGDLSTNPEHMKGFGEPRGATRPD